jgi:hypothetical protein
MKRNIKIAQLNLLIISTLILFIQSCSDGSEEEFDRPAQLIVTLIDSPAEYREVNIDIEEISLKTDGTTDNDGWIKLSDLKPGVYNILDFTGGQELPLADMEFPSGTISQVKLKLGKNNTLAIGDHMSTLMVANALEDGFKFTVHEILTKGETYYFRIDFDVAKSVLTFGTTGQLLLKPVLKLLSESSTGAISGEILPAEKNVLVNVIASNSIIASSYAPENSSKFFIPGIESGIYDISFESGNSGYQSYIRNVSVSTGKITDLGNISMADD